MRIKPLEDNEYPLFSRLMFWMQKKRTGTLLLASKIWGRSPTLYLGFSIFYAALIRRTSPIDMALKALVNTRVAQINQCPFCIDFNASLLKKYGVSVEKISALMDFENSEHFTQREKIALKYAELITMTGKKIDDQLFSQLQKQFSDNEIIELTAMISFENLSSKFNAALAIPAHGLYQTE